MGNTAQQTILITGAAGGVGRALCRVLAKAGFRVKALLRPEDDTRGLEVAKDDLFQGYVEDPQVVTAALKDVSAVIHCAALLPQAIHLGEKAFHRVNVEGALNVFEQAAKLKIAKLAFFSTISVVDHITRKITPCELQAYVHPRDPYLRSKIRLEKELEKRSRNFQGDIAILRPAFIYGPDHLPVWKEALELVREGKMMLLGKGNAGLPLISAEEIARFILLWLEQPLKEEKFHIYVLSSSEKTTMKQVFNFVADSLGVKRPRRVPAWPLFCAAAFLDLLPEKMKWGRMRLLTKTRVRQYSRGYDLSGAIHPPPLGFVAATRYQEGLTQMLDVYKKAIQTGKS